ncbi:MAG: hypothetical protein ACJAUV_001737, partial [Flavobacteriales bacterium]
NTMIIPSNLADISGVVATASQVLETVTKSKKA